MTGYYISVQCYSGKMLWKLNKKSHAYRRGRICPETSGRLKPFHKWNPIICWHFSPVVPPPGEGWLHLQAVGSSPEGAEVLVSTYASPAPRFWVVGWSQGLSTVEYSPKFLIFFLTFPVSPQRRCLLLPHLQTSLALMKFSVWAWNCNCIWVEELGVHVSATTSSRVVGAWQKSKQHCRSHHWSWEAYTRNSQTSEVIGGEYWELKVLQSQPDIGNHVINI